MSEVLLWSGVGLELAILAGLVVRRRVRHCYGLPVLLLAVLLVNASVGLCPSCNTWRFWNATELLHALLFLVLGLELSVRLFRYLPEARLWARASLAAVVAGAAALLATAPTWHPPSVVLLPRVLVAVAWLYLGLLAVTAVYRVPLERLHKAVLWGLAPYLLLYAFTWSRTGEDTLGTGVVNALVFAGALGGLAWAAWARAAEPDAGADPETVKVVWPWRS